MTDSTQTAQDVAQPVVAEQPQPEAAYPVAAEQSPQDVTAVGDGLAAIQTWTEPASGGARKVPLSQRTGEPTRVWTIWVAAVSCYLASAAVGISTLWIYWDAVSRFAEASWLMGQFETGPGSLVRVLLAVAVTVITLVVGVPAAITGYYAYDGRRWTRWSSLVAFVLSSLTLMLNRPAWAAMGLLAVAAVALWLPPSGRYFEAWRALRHHEPVFSPPPGQVWYGPLPRYR